MISNLEACVFKLAMIKIVPVIQAFRINFLLVNLINLCRKVACVAGAGGGEGVREGDRVEKIRKKKGRSEGMPALNALIGSILWLLTAAKFQLANQTIGGVGCHSILLLYFTKLR